MESGGGSQEPQAKSIPMSEALANFRRASGWGEYSDQAGDPPPQVSPTLEEQQRIADGEPYCFRCGKPASSFSEYTSNLEERQSFADYVREEEGTYNPETNRFACDGCYIAIGMPAGPNGWQAP